MMFSKFWSCFNETQDPDESNTIEMNHVFANRSKEDEIFQRMGLSLEASTKVVNVNGQNLSILEDFLQLEDKDVETLCRVIRRPGGVNAAGNQNQGMQVSAMA
jgi:hypothetical protein